MNGKDVTEKAIFERLYLISGRRTFALSINCPCASTPPTAHPVANSRFSFLFVQKRAHHFFGQHDSPKNLPESRYPRVAQQTNIQTSPSWAQWMWQQLQSLIVWGWCKIGDLWWHLLSCSHCLLSSYFLIFLCLEICRHCSSGNLAVPKIANKSENQDELRRVNAGSSINFWTTFPDSFF